jgi:hypothetical protein
MKNTSLRKYCLWGTRKIAVGAKDVETGIRKVKGEENRSHEDGIRTGGMAGSRNMGYREVEARERKA